MSANITYRVHAVSNTRHHHQEALLILRYVTLVIYLLTFLFGCVGNSLTILVIITNKKMKTVATCFILNLAVADDLFMLTLPFFAYSTFAKDWIFGSWLCTVMSALYGINLYASIFTMVSTFFTFSGVLLLLTVRKLSSFEPKWLLRMCQGVSQRAIH